MSQEANSGEEQKRMPLFLHEYRKKLSLLKIKSFYANHLCKKNCLEGKLNSNPESCFNACDEWLKNFYQIKREQSPEGAQAILYDVENHYEAIKNNEDMEYQKNYARAKLESNMYLEMLDNQLAAKIELESKGK